MPIAPKKTRRIELVGGRVDWTFGDQGVFFKGKSAELLKNALGFWVSVFLYTVDYLGFDSLHFHLVIHRYVCLVSWCLLYKDDCFQ